jgi:hypothetical protein
MKTEKPEKDKKKLTKEQIKKLRELKQKQIDDNELIKK